MPPRCRATINDRFAVPGAAPDNGPAGLAALGHIERCGIDSRSKQKYCSGPCVALRCLQATKGIGFTSRSTTISWNDMEDYRVTRFLRLRQCASRQQYLSPTAVRIDHIQLHFVRAI